MYSSDIESIVTGLADQFRETPDDRPYSGGKGWFNVQSAADYIDFSVRSIENAMTLKQIEFRRVRIKGERFVVHIKRECSEGK